MAAMKTTTYEGTVENGRVKLPDTVQLPDHTKVLVVVPDIKPEAFTIATGDDGLPVIRTNNGVITSQLVKEYRNSDRMTFLLDVNVLMALLWETHEHHHTARAWFRGVTDFATCPVTQLGFARVSSHPSLGYSMSPIDLSRIADSLSCQHFSWVGGPP
jgi:hypothetical protein